MSRILVAVAVAWVAIAGAAGAGPLAAAVAGDLAEQGFGGIVVREGPDEVRIEAVRGGRRIVLVYDPASGRLLSREVSRIGPVGVGLRRGDGGWRGGPEPGVGQSRRPVTGAGRIGPVRGRGPLDFGHGPGPDVRR